MRTILLISPYWKEPHRWMVSSYKLAELWQRLGFCVVVACMGETTGKEIVSPTLTIYRKTDFFLPDPWNYGISFGFTGFVKRIIANEKPDVVVVNKILFWSSLSVIALRLAGRRMILLTDALVGMTWWPRGWIPRIGAMLYAWTLGWLIMLCAEKIVFFHPQPESFLKKLGVWKKSQVIPTGIDSALYGRFPLPHPERSEGFVGEGAQHLRKRCGAGESKQDAPLTISYLGRLESVKGVDDFLAAATAVKKSHPDMIINVVGWHRDDHPLVKQYGHAVTFMGLRKDIPDILAKTDIFVLPSYSEGLSNALMEAMASGCACVASDVGGNRYLIQNGISGFLFPAGDRPALQSHLRRLFEDSAKRKQMGEMARRRIVEKFDWEIVGKQYRDLFS